MDENKKTDTKAGAAVPDEAAPSPGAKIEPGSVSASDAIMPDSAKETPPKPKGKKATALIVSLIVTLLLGGGAAAAYFYYYLPNRPQNILKKALVNTFSDPNLTSANFKGGLTIKGNDSNGMSLNGTFSGGMNNQGALTLSSAFSLGTAEVTADLRSTDGNNLYLNLTGVSSLTALLDNDASNPSISNTALVSGLENQWINFDQSTLSQLGASDITDVLIMKDVTRKKVADVYVANQLLSVKKILNNEIVSGMPSYHYQVVADKAKLKKFIAEIKAANLPDLTISNSRKKSLDKSIDSTNFAKYPIDVWIAKDTKYIDKISLTLKDDQKQVSFNLTITDFNKPIEVEKPANSKTFMEIFTDLTRTTVTGLKNLSPLIGLGPVDNTLL